MSIAQVVVGGRSGDDEPVTLAAPVGERDSRVPLRGREPLVRQLMQLWQAPGDGVLHVLHGMSGCGKTAVALEMVVRVHGSSHAHPCGERVWWVNARHPATFAAGMRAVARQAGVRPDEVQAGGVVDALWERLGHAPYQWLLVVDGVEDLSLLDGPGQLAAGTGWVRPHVCARGLVIITSPCGIARLWGGGAKLHAVRPLGADEAAGLLLDQAGGAQGTQVEARRLGLRLGGLPLALRIAASYLSEAAAMPESLRDAQTPVDFASYLAALDHQKVGVHPAGAVAGAWRMSVELLHRQGLVHARYLVGLLAAFSAAPVPYTILLQPSVLTALPGAEGLDGTTVWRTLSELAALQLVELDSLPLQNKGPLCVSLHPLIRDIARSGPQSAVPVALMERVLALKEVREGPENPDSWAVWRTLAPHCLDLLRWGRNEAAGFSPQDRDVCAEAAERAARYLQAQGLHRQAREALEEVLALRISLGADDLGTATTRHTLALALHSLGEWQAAQDLYEEVLQTLERGKGSTHTHTLTVRHELGRVLLDQGQLHRAREHLAAVRSAREEAGGLEDPDALNARHELARIAHGLDQWAQAHAEYEALLALQQRVSGEDHPWTVTVRHNYACLLQDMGLTQQAHQECVRTLEGRRALYGDDHPSTLSTGYLMAVILRAGKKPQQARAALAEVRQRSALRLGEQHPQTLRCGRLLQLWDGQS
ncbi:tetratricopeptide repeat protein [Streptomyces adustus]|uniref:tetratricopeptide repeat protein n=1 Tax=Streptomyces adustus TaxID=1609272 RepID=UPI003716FC53